MAAKVFVLLVAFTLLALGNQVAGQCQCHRMGATKYTCIQGGKCSTIGNVPDGVTHVDVHVQELHGPDIGVFPSSVQYMDVSRNEIITLNESTFSNTPDLISLDLSFNNITWLPTGLFDDLTELQTLYLQNCKLTAIPPEVLIGKINLQTLQLEHNKIAILPAYSFYDLPKLANLRLKWNPLKNISTNAFVNLPSLEVLDLIQYETIERVERAAIRNLPKLHTLVFSFNPLVTWEGAMENVPLLKILRLSYTEVITVPSDSFANLTGLEVLDWHDAKVHYLPPFLFKDCKKLKVMYFKGNPKLTLTENVFRDLPLATIQFTPILIQEIPSFAFNNIGTLSINFDLSRVVHIRRAAFLNLPGWTHVKIRSTALITFDAPFVNMTGVQSLDVSYSHVRTVPNDAFYGLTELKELNWHDSSLESLPQFAFKDCKNLQVVDLHSNKNLMFSPNVFLNLPELRTLNLQGINIREVPTNAFVNLPNITTLNFQGNKIEVVSAEAFVGLPELRTLALNFSSLKTFDAPFLNITGLRKLDLSNSQIRTVPNDTFYGLVELHELYWRHSSLEFLPQFAFKECKNLQVVDLSSNNNFMLSPNVFQNLPELRTLNLQGINIREVPTNAFVNLPNITTLNFQGKKIEVVSANAFVGLPELRTLDFRGNNIRKVPTNAFVSLSKLTTLDLLGNNIGEVATNSFVNLERLSTLRFDGLPITTFDSPFQRMSFLETLYLNKTQMTTVPSNTFLGLDGLTNLYWSSSSLVSLPQFAFRDCPNLRFLDLHSNPNFIVHPNVFHDLPKLEILDLNNVPRYDLQPNIFVKLPNLISLYTDIDGILQTGPNRNYELCYLASVFSQIPSRTKAVIAFRTEHNITTLGCQRDCRSEPSILTGCNSDHTMCVGTVASHTCRAPVIVNATLSNFHMDPVMLTNNSMELQPEDLLESSSPNVTIICTISGITPPRVYLRDFNGGNVKVGNTTVVSESVGEFGHGYDIITRSYSYQVDISTSGICLLCKATTNGGDINSTIEYKSPVISPYILNAAIESPDNSTMTYAGDDVTLKCSADAATVQTVIWYYSESSNFSHFTAVDLKQHHQSDYGKNETGCRPLVSSLRLIDVRPADSGYYGCLIFNAFGKRKFVFTPEPLRVTPRRGDTAETAGQGNVIIAVGSVVGVVAIIAVAGVLMKLKVLRSKNPDIQTESPPTVSDKANNEYVDARLKDLKAKMSWGNSPVDSTLSSDCRVPSDTSLPSHNAGSNIYSDCAMSSDKSSPSDHVDGTAYSNAPESSDHLSPSNTVASNVYSDCAVSSDKLSPSDHVDGTAYLNAPESSDQLSPSNTVASSVYSDCAMSSDKLSPSDHVDGTAYSNAPESSDQLSPSTIVASTVFSDCPMSSDDQL